MERKLTSAWENSDKSIDYNLEMKKKELRQGRDNVKGDEDEADLLTSYMIENEALSTLKCDDKVPSRHHLQLHACWERHHQVCSHMVFLGSFQEPISGNENHGGN